MRVVERWWNGSWGTLFRRDVRLQVSDDGIWQLYVRSGRHDATFDYRSEGDARAQLALLLDPDEGPWQRVDHSGS